MTINTSRQVVRRSHNDAPIRRLPGALEKRRIGVLILLYTRKGDIMERQLVGRYTDVRGNELDHRCRPSLRDAWTMVIN